MPPSKGATDLYKKDLYGILGVNEKATEKEIIKAYKKKALKYHPDKNPDNPKAAEQFQEVYEVCEILKDAASRAAYDQLRQAKKKADERTQALDSKRKKFKEDLEKREREAAELGKRVDAAEAERKLQQEILRLRREGSRLLEQEQERLREELKASSLADDGSSEENVSVVETPRVKLKWLAKKGDPGNGGYNTQNLTDILSCYGKLSALLVSSKRNGSAIVEFEGPRVDASILEETGLVDNPFAFIWLSGKPSASDEPAGPEVEEGLNGSGRPVTIPSGISGDSSVNFCESMPHIKMQDGFDSFSCGAGGSSSGTGDAGNDFENLVLRKMRQAEERKRLIAEMQAEDNDS